MGIIVLIGISIVALFTLSTFLTSNRSTTSSSVTVTSQSQSAQVTCTAIAAISYEYCPNPLRISAVGSPGATPFNQSDIDGTWNFTVTISSNSVTRGETIILVANLTNVGQNITFDQFVRPYINPIVTAANGTEVWAWDPPQSTWPNWKIASGETTSEQIRIPTSQLQRGQSYFINVAPISVQFPTPNNYTFTFRFSVN